MLEERIKAAGGLVEDEQLRVMHERLDHTDLLSVALGQRSDPETEIQIETLRELVDPSGRHTSTQVAQVGQQLDTGLVAIDDEVARQVSDAATQSDAIVSRVKPEHHRPAAGWTD